MREGLRVDRYTKVVLTLIVVLLAVLLCKPLFVARPAAGINGFGSLGKGLAEVFKSPSVYYLGLTDEEILSALKKEVSELQEEISKLTPEAKKEFTDDELKLLTNIAETTYDELKNTEKVAQVNIILAKLYAESFRVKFVANDFIILEK